MAIKDPWALAMSRLVRSEMTRRGWTYGRLLAALGEIGVDVEDERSFRNRVARGSFSAAFLVQIMLAMGEKAIPLGGREIEAALKGEGAEERLL